MLFSNFLPEPASSTSFISLIVSALGGTSALIQVGVIGVLLLFLYSFARVFKSSGKSLLLARTLALAMGILAARDIGLLVGGVETPLSIILLGLSFIFNQLQSEVTSTIGAGGFRPETPAERGEVGWKAIGMMAVSFVGMIFVSAVVALGQVILPLLGFVPGSAPALVISGMGQTLVGPGAGLISIVILGRGGLRWTRQTFLDRTFEEVARLRRRAYTLLALLVAMAILSGLAAWLYRRQPGALAVPLLLETVGPASVSSLIGGFLGALINWRVRMGRLPRGRREEGEFYYSLMLSCALTLLSAGVGFGVGTGVGVLFIQLLPLVRQSLEVSLQTVGSSLVDSVRYAYYSTLRANNMPLAVALAAGFSRPTELVEILMNDILARRYVQDIAELDLRSLRFFFGNLRSLSSEQVVFELCRVLARHRRIGRRVVKSVDDATLLQMLYPGRLNIAALDLIPPPKLFSFVERGDLGERNLREALSFLSPVEVAKTLVALVECGAQRFDFVKWALAPYLTKSVWDVVRREYPRVLPQVSPRLMRMFAEQSASYAQALKSLSGVPAHPSTPAAQPTTQPQTPGQPDEEATEVRAAYPPPAAPTAPTSPGRARPAPSQREALEQRQYLEQHYRKLWQRRQARLNRLRGPRASVGTAPDLTLERAVEPLTEEEVTGSAPTLPAAPPAPPRAQPPAPSVPPTQEARQGRRRRRRRGGQRK